VLQAGQQNNRQWKQQTIDKENNKDNRQQTTNWNKSRQTTDEDNTTDNRTMNGRQQTTDNEQ
jgi:hypothetical protein